MSLFRRRVLLVVAILLIVLSWWGVAAARTGLSIHTLERENLPMLFVAPQNGENLPGVLVAHGFAGSKQLMLGYAHVLAHGGYAVLLWDFRGHGANQTPFSGFSQSELQNDLEIARASLLNQPEVDPTRLALVGHSMGSSAVMSASIAAPNLYRATVAVSPIEAPVTPRVPFNLQLQIGSWEGRLMANAQRLLQAAGGANDNLATGKGRSLVIVPHVEHITILFSPVSHQAALQWLNATFNLPLKSDYVDEVRGSPVVSRRGLSDRRLFWYGLHLIGWLLVLSVFSPVEHYSTHSHQPVRSWLGLLAAPLAATGVLMLLSRSGVPIESFGGLLVGGSLGIWFLVAGVVWLGIQGQIPQIPRPAFKAIRLGLALFGLLWVAFGAMAQVTWLQWWLIPARLPLWLVLAGASFPWFLASGIAQKDGFGSRVVWWLGQSAVLIGGLFLSILVLPQLGFIFLLLPLFPLVWAIFSLAAAQIKNAWSYALGSSLFFGWLLAAAFPLV